ncbi:hypothetical protein [Kitasatospora sp. NPDC001175]|uniref:hypothetical protein n=1 Tax=Kitasatospora sp. NPDC001175 TaxID=3157103 RepID=UPI003CFE2F4F
MTKHTAVPARLTFGEIAARIQRPRRIVDLVLDAEAAAEIEGLEDLLGRLTRPGVERPEEAEAVAARLHDARTAVEDSQVAFTLQAISHRAYQDLRREHPATREQIENAKSRGEAEPAFDPDSFAPALVRAQLLDPAPADEAEFIAFWRELSDGQLSRLWSAALAVQLQITTP